MSKTQSLSQNFSRWANFLKFATTKDNIISGNTQPYGSPTIKQTQDGIFYPNVQSAIDDVASLYTLPINSVVINTDGISPAGKQQIDRYTFTGVVAVNGLNVELRLNTIV